MLTYTSAMRVILLFALLSTLAACGQTGSLYLPDEAIESPVEIRTTAPPAPAPPPSAIPAPKDDKKEEKPAEPPDR
jgi:predicted small lipoprotein YifL